MRRVQALGERAAALSKCIPGQRVAAYFNDFNYWSRVGGPAYRFSEVVPDEKLKESIGEIISQLGDSVHSEGRGDPLKFFFRMVHWSILLPSWAAFSFLEG